MPARALDILTGGFKPNPAGPTSMSGGVGAAVRNNALFSSRGSANQPLLTTGNNSITPIQRGFMSTGMGVTPKITLNFMYNPPEINASYDIDESKLLPIETLTGDDAAAVEGVPMLVGGASMSFALMFDRTVEVARSRNGRSNSASDIGVLHDLGVLERLIGATPTGQIISNPIDVHFTRKMKKPALNFSGYIVASQVFFGGSEGMFNQDMVPTRCTVTITMRRIYAQAPAGGTTDYTGSTGGSVNPGDTTATNSSSSSSGSPATMYSRSPSGNIVGISNDGGRTWAGPAPGEEIPGGGGVKAVAM